MTFFGIYTYFYQFVIISVFFWHFLNLPPHFLLRFLRFFCCIFWHFLEGCVAMTQRNYIGLGKNRVSKCHIYHTNHILENMFWTQKVRSFWQCIIFVKSVKVTKYNKIKLKSSNYPYNTPIRESILRTLLSWSCLYFYHGPDLNRAMIMCPPCWKGTR